MRQGNANSYAAVVGSEWLPHPTEIEQDVYSSPVGSPGYVVQSPESEKIGGEKGEEEKELGQVEGEFVRISNRNQKQKMGDVREQAAQMMKKWNLEGNDINSSPIDDCNNSFAILSNDEIMRRASLMGVGIPYDNFDKIDLMKT